ncbi:protein TonB [Flavobacteriaceae bacterium MAR_2010_105]|nr:protein TonB [Flavobacteriaceae bacterium MAR_2010_105]
MIPKKNPNVDVGRNSSLYFAIGLILMLLATRALLEYKTYDKSAIDIDKVYLEETFEDEIPIIKVNTPPPPPPPITVTETLVIVEDVSEIEETIIESSEITQEDAIAERIISVDEIKVETVEEDVEVPFHVIESVPVFPGCEGGTKEQIKACFQSKIQEHVMKNFVYPQQAQELGIHGRVFVMFMIDKNGYITNIKSRGPDKVLEQEAERIIRLLPKMIPGKQRGKPVKVPYSIPINFVYVAG